ncbi:MAG: hypothetical protein B7Y39_18810 [Bdellovibrio sp. 28-41-41]|nr:MAG: hypothetical protein B7Y39_18810 [Bdellovibrio sp. 28-41-41]
MSKKLGVSLRLEEEKIEQLDSLAKATHRDRSFLISEAIDNYLEVQQWQINHIKNAIQQADMKDFASADAIKRILSK